MSAPGTGFALMQFSSILDSAYEASPFAKNAEKELKILRNALPFIKPDQYRGIGRYPFNADYAYDAPGGNGLTRTHRSARMRLQEPGCVRY